MKQPCICVFLLSLYTDLLACVQWYVECTHGGGVQSMMGVTGAQSMSAVVSTTRDMRPRPALVRSKSDGEEEGTIEIEVPEFLKILRYYYLANWDSSREG